MKDKLLDRSKCQTIRLPRKKALKVGDKVYLYWRLRQKDCQKLGEGIITKIETRMLAGISNEQARLDGFEDTPEPTRALGHLYGALKKMHSEIDWHTKFDIITWEWIS